MSTGNGPNPARRRSTHPYRDSALTYAGLAVVVVIVAFATGSGILRSLLGGVAAFLLATAWTWWRFRTRERAGERRSP
jgi:hypothetical protein